MKNILILALLGWFSNAFAECIVLNSQGLKITALNDVLFHTLTTNPGCPQNVLQLKQRLKQDGLTATPSMVANRGRHNPKLGSFSFFEVVQGPSLKLGRMIELGEFYFGHFTGLNGNSLELDQAPVPNKLMIELIVWDQSKQMFNFYELIGKANGAQWFYRGDSRDAYLDNQKLHRQSIGGRPQFGRSMRCSACHNSGGPIMKELELPHNDWWTAQRPLPLGNSKPSAQVTLWLNALMDANDFSKAIKTGMKKLDQSSSMQQLKQGLSLQEQLRPVFCTTEVNLVSSQAHLGSADQVLKVPSYAWVHGWWKLNKSIEVQRKEYEQVIAQNGFRFPENNQSDADHAWLVPVNGHSDGLAIDQVINEKLVDQEFVADVLAVDFKSNLFSSKRCGLLKLLPEAQTTDWLEVFKQTLLNNNTPAALELHSNLTQAQRNKTFHLSNVELYLNSVQEQVLDVSGVETQVLSLAQKRQSVFENEISKNPLGQIFEPGFRVIFPVIK